MALWGGAAVFTVVLLIWGTLAMVSPPPEPLQASQPQPTPIPAPHHISPSAPPQTAAPDHTEWAGPILYRDADATPFQLILVEKATQSLHLYRYHNGYSRIKTYHCGTGEKQGKKKRENDEKTPEGIYFNTRTFRDTKITIFGDRAFELNYPSPFDHLDRNGGHGIYIHGSNRDVTPYSTNGCIALNNDDLADLDRRVDMKNTPIIIGERLPYRFDAPQTDLKRIIPFLKKAMIPESVRSNDLSFKEITVIGYRQAKVAIGDIRLDADGHHRAQARLYVSEPVNDLLVLIKREWAESKPLVASAASPPPARPAPKPTAVSAVEADIRRQVSAWRRAWAGKDIDAYISHYHPEFVGNGKNRTQWKAYKDRLNRRYRTIRVSISGLQVKTGGSGATAYFTQAYKSDKFQSTGYKILEFRKHDGNWKIYREKSYAQKPSGWPG